MYPPKCGQACCCGGVDDTSALHSLSGALEGCPNQLQANVESPDVLVALVQVIQYSCSEGLRSCGITMPDNATRYHKAQGNSQSTTVQDQRPTLRELHLMASLFLQWLSSAQNIFVLKVVLVAREADILSHDGQGQ